MSATIARREIASGAQEVFALLGRGKVRLVSIFGAIEDDGARRLRYILELDGQQYCIYSVPVEGVMPSATAITPAAAWYERELHDLYGVEFSGHPNLQPLVFHENWPAGVHPNLGERARATGEYRFLKVQGEGVCEVAVGPIHAGVIEPGHFRFSVVGDTVLHLELRHFYTHKGAEKLFEDTPVMNGTMIAECVSGDNCFAHAVAYCQAVEDAFGIEVPPRGRALRLIGLELERMLAHIADVGALCGDVAFTLPGAYTARIKELLLQASARLLGTRCWRGLAIPGGMKRGLSEKDAQELGRVVAAAAADFAELAKIILATPSVQNRFEGTGVVKREVARELAMVGPAARASGLKLDVRRDHPYGAYGEIELEVPHYHYGDVLARARMRIDETAISAQMIGNAIAALPAGAMAVPAPRQGSGEGFSAVESPRGELLYWIRVQEGRIRRCHIKSPSFQNWPALPLSMPGNIIADFPLINKSFNLSYSGCDR